MKIVTISDGESYDVLAENGNLVCTCESEDGAKAIVGAFDVLVGVSLDCQMALCGDWDKGDDGFNSTQQLVDDAIRNLGEEPPEHEREKED